MEIRWNARAATAPADSEEDRWVHVDNTGDPHHIRVRGGPVSMVWIQFSFRAMGGQLASAPGGFPPILSPMPYPTGPSSFSPAMYTMPEPETPTAGMGSFHPNSQNLNMPVSRPYPNQADEPRPFPPILPPMPDNVPPILEQNLPPSTYPRSSPPPPPPPPITSRSSTIPLVNDPTNLKYDTRAGNPSHRTIR